MKTILTIFIFSTTFSLFGQDCDCRFELSYIIKYYEDNNPAYQKIKSTAKDNTKYEIEKAKLLRQAKQEKSLANCIILLDRYVNLLRDHHSDIGYNLKRIDLSTPELISSFKASEKYQQFIKIPIDTLELKSYFKKKVFSDIEGVYSDGGKIVFGIVKNTNRKNGYQGIVLQQNKLLEVGHVLLELTQKSKTVFDVNYNVGLLGFNFDHIFKRLKIENGQIPNFGFSKVPVGSRSSNKAYEFKALTDSVNYLRLSDFDSKLTQQLNNFYSDIDKEIQSKPNLIIDLRNNGGGSESSYLNLLPYVYTRPLKIDPALVWVSPENIRRYEESAGNKELIERMKQSKPFTFIPYVTIGENTWTIDSLTVYPKKVVLLFDKGTASAAEGMITYFMQSDKVITVGENSGGYIGYGNVMSTTTPCEKFRIRCTTTQYEEKSKYEFVGIAPMHQVSKDSDWIEFALKLLKE